ncbi:MAG: HEAT repeat domain-containing protein [Planctomycetota bacterium]|jgi:HEAT repeat protein
MRSLCLLFCLTALVCADEKADDEAAKSIVAQLKSKEDSIVLAGLLEAATNQSKSLTSPVIKLLKHKNPAVRQSAIEVLGGRRNPSAQKKAAQSLCYRLKPLSAKEEQQAELLVVIQALHDLEQPLAIKPLLSMDSGTPREVLTQCAMAVGNVPSKEAVDRLIQYGYKDRRGAGRTRDIAVKALRYATQEKVKGNIEAWRKWWSDNEKDFDPLIAAEKRAEARAAAKEKEERKKNRRKKRKKK